ncbi:uncharacterized protein LOC107458846 isoform X1 [Arachis duranensis]|uniref:E3 ubiquitin-protein ligase RMA n=2 Tax=Arachis duranensis TaxID=130453 RepID=A0A6P4B1Q2_ARADU|nr:uncharacterized protein LOC107458846 isoform X1 [Arachis duranensis]
MIYCGSYECGSYDTLRTLIHLKCGGADGITKLSKMTEVVAELDLNQQPLHDIEERIRRLEGIIFRVRQRQRWCRSDSPVRMTTFAGEVLVDGVQDEGRPQLEEVEAGDDVKENGNVESSSCRGKRKASAYLVAKALGMETNTDKAKGRAGNYFDCNICLKMARDPVLTCCGHLFCWPCFFRLSYAYANARECPVCEGEVMITCITPIYGSVGVNDSDQLESEENGCEIPARPCARRVKVSKVKCFRNRGFPINNPRTSAQSSSTVIQGIALPSPPITPPQRPLEGLDSYLGSDSEGSTMQLNHNAASNHSESHNQNVIAAAATSSVTPLTMNDDAIAITDSSTQITNSSGQIISSDRSSLVELM